MIDTFDKKIMKLAQEEADRTPKLPQGFDEHIETILNGLPTGKKEGLHGRNDYPCGGIGCSAVCYGNGGGQLCKAADGSDG